MYTDIDIDLVEDNIDKVIDDKYRKVIIILIDSIRTLPTDEYNFQVYRYIKYVSKELNVDTITEESIDRYLITHGFITEDRQVWTNEALEELKDVLKLMKLFNINFEELFNEMRRISEFPSPSFPNYQPGK